MTDLTEFLLARLASEENLAVRVARIAPMHDPREWRWRHASGDPLQIEIVSPTGMAVPLARAQSYVLQAAHIVHWQPSRVFAECDAKRKIIEQCSATDASVGDDVLRLLALPYADHPDYLEEWKP